MASSTAFKCTSCRKTFASAGNLKRHKTKKKPCDRKSVKARQKESKKKRQQRNKSYYQKKKRERLGLPPAQAATIPSVTAAPPRPTPTRHQPSRHDNRQPSRHIITERPQQLGYDDRPVVNNMFFVMQPSATPHSALLRDVPNIPFENVLTVTMRQ